MFGLTTMQKRALVNSASLLTKQPAVAGIGHVTAAKPVAAAYIGPRMHLHSSAPAAIKQSAGAGRNKEPVETSVSPRVLRIDPSLPGQTMSSVEKIKAYALFYFAGLKELVGNARLARAIRVRQQNNAAGVSRAELQLVRRHAEDKLRLLPFSITMLVFMEFSPLMFLLFPQLCPSTCVTYGQAVGMAKKHDKLKLQLHAQALDRIQEADLIQSNFSSVASLSALVGADQRLFTLAGLGRNDLLLICQFMNISNSIFSKVTSTSGLKKSLQKRLEYLRQDDRLLVKEGLVDRLPVNELHRACQERGIPSADHDEDGLRKALRGWTALTFKSKSLDGMLPIVWSRLVLFNKAVTV
ncbi:hypothetical protein GGI26_006270 [Coemansia sp. RSA 1358]|nr:hypothetical protein GGI26_006270 [Coemansia sp. RSA 1358]